MASRYPVVRQLGKLANIVAGDALLLRGALNEAPTATIASAGSIDIGAAISNTINITGAVAITSLGTVAAGVQRTLVFGGASTLTHNATSLILPTAANIVPAADDTAEFLSLGAGNWRCTRYQRKSGYALLDATGGGGGSATQTVAISAGVLDISASTATTIVVDLNANVTSVILPVGSVGNVVERSIVFTQSGAANFTVTGWAGVTIEGGVAPVATTGVGAVTEYLLSNANNGGWRMYVDQGVTTNATPSVAGLMSAADKTKLDTYPAVGLSTTLAVMTSTQQSTVIALANVTQLVLALAANATYYVECFLTFQSAATTTGINAGFVAPTGSTPMLEVTVPLVSTAAATHLRKIFPNAAELTTGSVLGTGVTAITSNHTVHFHGLVRTTTAGNLQIQFASEVAASAITLQIGSTLMAERLA